MENYNETGGTRLHTKHCVYYHLQYSNYILYKPNKC